MLSLTSIHRTRTQYLGFPSRLLFIRSKAARFEQPIVAVKNVKQPKEISSKQKAEGKGTTAILDDEVSEGAFSAVEGPGVMIEAKDKSGKGFVGVM